MHFNFSRDQITLAVLRLKEGGTLHTLQHRWWVEKGQCGGDGTGSSKVRICVIVPNLMACNFNNN